MYFLFFTIKIAITVMRIVEIIHQAINQSLSRINLLYSGDEILYVASQWQRQKRSCNTNENLIDKCKHKSQYQSVYDDTYLLSQLSSSDLVVIFCMRIFVVLFFSTCSTVNFRDSRIMTSDGFGMLCSFSCKRPFSVE